MTVTQQIEPVLYHGNELTFEPVNMPLAEVGRLVANGDGVGVELQPGDGTRYVLLVAPCWAPRYRAAAGGGVGGTGEGYLLVAMGLGGSMYPLTRWANEGHVLSKLWPHGGNPHSARVVVGFIQRLWREIDNAS